MSKSPPEPEQYLTSAEVATRCGISQRTVIRWADAGRLPIAGFGSNATRLFREGDVKVLAAEEAQKAAARAAALTEAAS